MDFNIFIGRSDKQEGIPVLPIPISPKSLKDTELIFII